MDTDLRLASESCSCPLCTLYNLNVAKVRRWATERRQAVDAAHAQKLAEKRAHHAELLQKLRTKHADQLRRFDETIEQLTAGDRDDGAESAHLDDEAFQREVDDLLHVCKQDYFERMYRLDGVSTDDAVDDVTLVTDYAALYDQTCTCAAPNVSDGGDAKCRPESPIEVYYDECDEPEAVLPSVVAPLEPIVEDETEPESSPHVAVTIERGTPYQLKVSRVDTCRQLSD